MPRETKLKELKKATEKSLEQGKNTIESFLTPSKKRSIDEAAISDISAGITEAVQIVDANPTPPKLSKVDEQRKEIAELMKKTKL